MALVRIAFEAKDYASGQQVLFRVFNKDNNLIYQGYGLEWGNTGVYYIEGDLDFTLAQTYLIVALDITGEWKSTKLISKQDIIE